MLEVCAYSSVPGCLELVEEEVLTGLCEFCFVLLCFALLCFVFFFRAGHAMKSFVGEPCSKEQIDLATVNLGWWITLGLHKEERKG